MLKRAIRTCWIALDELDLLWIPVERDWRLNERHYGALQGLNKAETAAKHGEAQTKIWRRSYDIPPPPLDADDPRHPSHDPRYASLAPAELPRDRVAQGHRRALPALLARARSRRRFSAGQRVLITAHGNSLRALVKYLDGISDEDIVELNIPTGIPLVYELDATLAPIRHYYLGDPERGAAARPAEAVAEARGERLRRRGRIEPDVYSTSFSVGLVRRDPQRLEEAPIVGAHLERRLAARCVLRAPFGVRAPALG